MQNPIFAADPETDSERESGDVRPGTIVAEKYRVEARIARGGMATILRAEHLGLGERVALKLLLPRFRNSPEFVGRFRREARAAARLRSEHVARVLDFGALEDGSPYLAMDLLEGHDLEAHLLEHGPLPMRVAVDLVLQASEALAEAHAIGIVHRDLKPQNLFLTKSADGVEVLKVIDFGIAKNTGGGALVTGKHTSMGTPHYMSPEQLHASDSVDARSDIWSLGVILHELLTGRNVFDAPTPRELLMLVANGQPVLSLEPHHPSALRAVLERCLATNRNVRFESVRELAQALVPFGTSSAATRVARLRRVEDAARSRGVTNVDIDAPPSLRDIPVVGSLASSLATMASSQVFEAPRQSRRRVVAAAAGLAFAGLIVAFAPRGHGEPATRHTAPAAASAAPAPATIPSPIAEAPEALAEARAVEPPRAIAPAASTSAKIRTAGPGRDRLFKSRK